MAKRAIVKSKSAVVEEIKDLVASTPVAHVFEGDKRLRVSELFSGPQYESVRKAVMATGEYRTEKTRLKIATRPIEGETDDKEILAIASVSRDPGSSYDSISAISDFLLRTNSKAQEVEFFWRIYSSEGLINNGVNKVAAILSGGGEFKVRAAKKGRKSGPEEELKILLTYWLQAVNAAADNAVVTGSRGLQSVVHQGVRQALVEGDWFGRTIWNNVTLPQGGNYSLPINIQTISSGQLTPVLAVQPLGAELYFWTPPSVLLQQLNNPDSKEIKQILKKMLSNDVVKQLTKDQKVLLDPSLLMHVKHRGRDTSMFGESFITPAIEAIAYKRAIDQLDLATMQNLINRLTIVMVGSDDPASPYAKADVAAARAALLQQFFEEPGPNMTIIWAGNDIKIEDVGAFNEVLNLNDRHKIGTTKIKDALGVPEALLTGSSADGKASGFAAIMSAGAELQELQNNFAQVITTIGERIAVENGFTDIDLVYEFSGSLLIDKVEEQNQTRLDYMAGLATIRDVLLSRGKDPEATFLTKCEERGLDPATALWEEAFAPPQGMPGQAPTGTTTNPTGPGTGKPADTTQGVPTKAPVTQHTTLPNK